MAIYTRIVEDREPKTVFPLDKETKDIARADTESSYKPTAFEQQELKRLRDLAIRYRSRREHHKKTAFEREEELAHARYQNEQLQAENAGLEEQLTTIFGETLIRINRR
jgi:hypothetical protein